MDEQNRSGNRWEPEAQTTQPVRADAPLGPDAPIPAAATGTAVLPPESPQAPPHPSPPGAGAATGDGTPPRRPWQDWREGRPGRPLVLGIAAAVLLLVVGVGCFALGRATAPDGFREFDGRQGFAPGQGQGPGQMPGQGPQGFDRDDDGDGANGGFPQQQPSES